MGHIEQGISIPCSMCPIRRFPSAGATGTGGWNGGEWEQRGRRGRPHDRYPGGVRSGAAAPVLLAAVCDRGPGPGARVRILPHGRAQAVSRPGGAPDPAVLQGPNRARGAQGRSGGRCGRLRHVNRRRSAACVWRRPIGSWRLRSAWQIAAEKPLRAVFRCFPAVSGIRGRSRCIAALLRSLAPPWAVLRSGAWRGSGACDRRPSWRCLRRGRKRV